MPSVQMILITEEEYKNLVRRDAILTALECGGVDNWEWYSDSLNDFLPKEYQEG